MENCIGDIYILNGRITGCDTINLSLLNEGITIYEVIRIINKKYLFLEEHLQRLNTSARVANISLWMTKKELIECLYTLKNTANFENNNVKMAFNFTGTKNLFVVYGIENRYPSKNDYSEGIRTILVNAERIHPNVKIFNYTLRTAVDKKIERTGSYEALLVNKKGYITEGNRSNVFFVRHNHIITPPLEQVLPGITRNHVMAICKRLRITLYENSIHTENLKDFNAAFITGTSPKVLPVQKINDIQLSVQHTLINTLIQEYNKDIMAYISGNKGNNKTL